MVFTSDHCILRCRCCNGPVIIPMERRLSFDSKSEPLNRCIARCCFPELLNAKEHRSSHSSNLPNHKTKMPDSTVSNSNPNWRKKLRVLLFIPNILDYFRCLIIFFAFGYAKEFQNSYLFAFLYVFNFALDGIDGMLARKLHQESGFGAFMDVAVDNFARSLMWASATAVPHPPPPVVVAAAAASSGLTAIGSYGGILIPCIEWMAFVCTHAGGGAAWKTGCFVNAPPWITAVLAHGFRNWLGVLVMGGLHFFPLWLFLRVRSAHDVFSLCLGFPLYFGRMYCLAIELWVILRYLDSLLTKDAVEN